MKKYIIALAIIVIIVAVALMVWLRPSLVEEFKPTATTPIVEDANHPEEITLIENELASFDLGDLDAEFQAVDQEISNL